MNLGPRRMDVNDSKLLNKSLLIFLKIVIPVIPRAKNYPLFSESKITLSLVLLPIFKLLNFQTFKYQKQLIRVTLKSKG